jgi:hypothetical protein
MSEAQHFRPDVQIWRVYNSGHVKNETHTLWPHDGYKGYDGDVSAWSDHNKKFRFGCAQIVQEGSQAPRVIFNGYLDDARLAKIIQKGLPGQGVGNE